MNQTYAYLRYYRKIKYRMVSAQHFINEAPELCITRINYILQYNKIENCFNNCTILNCSNSSQYYCVYCIFCSKKCSLGEKNNKIEIVSGYVCNHGSPSGERDTASPRGRYGERLQRDSCLKIHM